MRPFAAGDGAGEGQHSGAAADWRAGPGNNWDPSNSCIQVVAAKPSGSRDTDRPAAAVEALGHLVNP